MFWVLFSVNIFMSFFNLFCALNFQLGDCSNFCVEFHTIAVHSKSTPLLKGRETMVIIKTKNDKRVLPKKCYFLKVLLGPFFLQLFSIPWGSETITVSTNKSTAKRSSVHLNNYISTLRKIYNSTIYV